MSRFISLFLVLLSLTCVFAQYEQQQYPEQQQYDMAPSAFVEQSAEQQQLSGYGVPLPEQQPMMDQQPYEQEQQMMEQHETAPAVELVEPNAMVETESDAFIESECTPAGCPSRARRTRGAARTNKRSLLRNRRHDIAPQFYGGRKHIVKRQQYGKRNSAGTKSGRFECRGGGCERATQGRRRAASGTRDQPRTKVDKLSVAFQAVKEEIMSRAQELKSEKKWSGAVQSLVKNYRKKVKKVNEHVDELKKETRNLLRKKKQIQNAQLQNKLTGKLKIAQANMSLLQKQLTHIANKESEFAATERNLKQTMRQLQLHLTKLKGASTPQVKHKKYV